jgi:hypothetical protein
VAYHPNGWPATHKRPWSGRATLRGPHHGPLEVVRPPPMRKSLWVKKIKKSNACTKGGAREPRRGPLRVARPPLIRIGDSHQGVALATPNGPMGGHATQLFFSFNSFFFFFLSLREKKNGFF